MKDHSTINLGLPMIYLFHFQTTIRQKYMIFFHLFFFLCTTIRPKIRLFIDLFLLFTHDHLTKVRGHSYSLIYSFLNCANNSFAIFKAVLSYISFALFLAVLPLYFVRYIHSSTNYPYILYTVFIEVLLLYIS